MQGSLRVVDNRYKTKELSTNLEKTKVVFFIRKRKTKEFVQGSFRVVNNWYKMKKLSINLEKTGVVLFTRKRKIAGFIW